VSTLTVELNRESPHDVSVASTFSTETRFTIELVNTGEPIHVHLHLDDTLSRVAALATNNHFLGRKETVTVEIPVSPRKEPTSGRLKIVTGHGSEIAYTTITVSPPATGTQRVAVDEKLSQPKPNPDPEPSVLTVLSNRLSNQSALTVLFAVFAVLLALGIGLSIGDPLVLVGSLVVIIGAVGAIVIANSW